MDRLVNDSRSSKTSSLSWSTCVGFGLVFVPFHIVTRAQWYLLTMSGLQLKYVCHTTHDLCYCCVCVDTTNHKAAHYLLPPPRHECVVAINQTHITPTLLTDTAVG